MLLYTKYRSKQPGKKLRTFQNHYFHYVTPLSKPDQKDTQDYKQCCDRKQQELDRKKGDTHDRPEKSSHCQQRTDTASAAFSPLPAHFTCTSPSCDKLL